MEDRPRGNLREPLGSSGEPAGGRDGLTRVEPELAAQPPRQAGDLYPVPGRAAALDGEFGRAGAVHLDWVCGKAGQLGAFVLAVGPEVRLDHHGRSVGGQCPQQFHRGGAEPA